jgi:hypothetical protein
MPEQLQRDYSVFIYLINRLWPARAATGNAPCTGLSASAWPDNTLAGVLKKLILFT